MTDLVLLDPPAAAAWFPFADSRPICELRAGAWLIRERWEAIAGGETGAIFGSSHLGKFSENGVPPVRTISPVTGPTIIGRSDFAPSGTHPDLPDRPARLTNEGRTVGWSVPADASWDGAHNDGPEVEVEGVVLRGTFDLVTALEHLLAPDVADFTQEQGDPVPDGCVVIGDPAEVVILGAFVEPGVTFDVRQGAIVLEQQSYVKSGTRLEGPLYVGAGCEVLGGPISRCSLGPSSKIRGEMHSTVLLGYANKAHDGFVGHSVIGRWSNLGAGTITSNLKNTCGTVALEIDDERVETDRQFLGGIIGDHVKTAIGTLFGTGSAVGTGANVFGATHPPRYIPPFAWGSAGDRTRRDGFLTTAERVLPRRNVAFTKAVRDMLGAIYDHSVTR